ncbi:MAG: ABC transporter ATP-binding protein [bacterium]
MAAIDALRLEGVTKRFGAVTALHEAWLNVREGEFVTLLGPSGCGKTTLLNLIAGFLEADAGEIFIGGKLVTTLPVWERDLGMVFQSYALFPHMDVARNVGYGLRARGVPKSEEAARVAEALGLVRLSALADRRPKQLSGGQQQRVALARALVIRPRLLLLDEPFSALDRNLRAEMQLELKEIQHRLGVTTIFVTHDRSEAMSMSDRVAVMSEGRILQLDTPEAIYGRPTHPFVAGFIGDATVLPGRLIARDGASAQVEAAGLPFTVPAETLGEADGHGIGHFAAAAILDAPSRIAERIFDPTEKHIVVVVDAPGGRGAGGGHRLGVAEGTPVGLAQGVVMGMHDHRLAREENLEAMLGEAAGPFVILGILEILADGDLIDNGSMGDATDHAEKMIPVLGFPLGTEAAVIVMGKDSLAIRPWNLPGKRRAKLGICQAGPQ